MMTTFAPFKPTMYEWISVESLTPWNDLAGTGLTLTIDNDVQFNGHPTLRLDIPALSSGTYRVGTSAATITLPSQIHAWGGQQWLHVAIRTDNLAAVDNVNLFFGDAGFANYYTQSFDEDNYPELIYRAGDWMIRPTAAAFGVGAGSPTFSGAKRLRVNFTVASDASPTKVWIGGIGFVPRNRAKCVITLDDGYDEHYSFVRGESSTYGIPVSYSIAKDLIDTAGYMTRANLVTMAADELSCLTNHARVNDSYATLGLAAYMGAINECRVYLQDVGAGNGPNHHAYVQSVWDRALSDEMQSAGYLSARAGISTGMRNWQDKTIPLENTRRFALTGGADLETGVTLANVQNYVDAAITAQETIFIVGHRFDVAAGVDQWATSDFTALLAYLRGKQKQGLIDCMRWDDWYMSLTQPQAVA